MRGIHRAHSDEGQILQSLDSYSHYSKCSCKPSSLRIASKRIQRNGFSGTDSAERIQRNPIAASYEAGGKSSLTFVSHGFLLRANDVPGSSDNVPGASDEVPGSSDNVTGTSGEVAGSSDNVPGTSGKVAGSSDNVPGTSGKVAGSSDNVPGTSGEVAGSSDNVTGTSGSIAGASNNFPGSSAHVIESSSHQTFCPKTHRGMAVSHFTRRDESLLSINQPTNQ